MEKRSFFIYPKYLETSAHAYRIVGLISCPEDTPRSTISKENDSFNIFQDHFYNKLVSSKMLLKYTDNLNDKQGHLTQALLHKNEPLRWF